MWVLDTSSIINFSNFLKKNDVSIDFFERLKGKLYCSWISLLEYPSYKKYELFKICDLTNEIKKEAFRIALHLTTLGKAIPAPDAIIFATAIKTRIFTIVSDDKHMKTAIIYYPQMKVISTESFIEIFW